MSENTPLRQHTLPAEQVKALQNLKAAVHAADHRYSGALEFLMQSLGFQKAQISDDCSTLTEVE